MTGAVMVVGRPEKDGSADADTPDRDPLDVLFDETLALARSPLPELDDDDG